MNTEKLIRESKRLMITFFVIGGVLLAGGVSLRLFDINIVSNIRAVIGLSFIPLSMGMIYLVKYFNLKKNPQKMKSIVVYESDERLVAIKNEADSKAFNILKTAIFLSYMGYTLLYPEDIFETVGWWILLGLLLISFVVHGFILSSALKKENASREIEE